MSQRVILVHGIWMPGPVMAWLGARLREAGFDCTTFSYHGVTRGPQEAVARLGDLLARDSAHILAHSLGGLVAMQALHDHPALAVERVVCLGSPLHGSRAVHGMRQRPWAAALLGQAAPLLERGFEQWSGRAQVGSIAGSVPHGLGHVFGDFADAHDGSVAVAETRLPGLADHAVIRASHSGMLFSTEAARLAIRFFRAGHFAGDADATP
ncbi:esterase/lipase family protein [Lysobacter solisilvae (ex Woo and Kim 2020)]|uniref:Alpha/beta hydrolase n=1 Tax=Agrilutibacter terrestris TaxID=2865112 RepID=A0A7H0FZ30_9GAMM|nr:alpha/beta hydrolase [Lysobacter terrestris]QNP41296.1 alpha/beta hydrolase [Lysobacter terrestris]